MRASPCSTDPWPVALTALCRDIPRLEANYCLLLKTCRYFSIYLYGTLRRRRASVYFVFVLLMLGDPWDDLALFFYTRKTAQWYLPRHALMRLVAR